MTALTESLESTDFAASGLKRPNGGESSQGAKICFRSNWERYDFADRTGTIATLEWTGTTRQVAFNITEQMFAGCFACYRVALSTYPNQVYHHAMLKNARRPLPSPELCQNNIFAHSPRHLCQMHQNITRSQGQSCSNFYCNKTTTYYCIL